MRVLRWPIAIHVHFEWPACLRRRVAPLAPSTTVHTVQVRNVLRADESDEPELYAILEFNGCTADSRDPEYVDLSQLQLSLEKSGTFFIWTCSCGAPGCAGLFHGVDVKHLGDQAIWHDLDRNQKFRFDIHALRAAYQNAIIEGRRMLHEHKVSDTIPPQNAANFEVTT